MIGLLMKSIKLTSWIRLKALTIVLKIHLLKLSNGKAKSLMGFTQCAYDPWGSIGHIIFQGLLVVASRK